MRVDGPTRRISAYSQDMSHHRSSSVSIIPSQNHINIFVSDSGVMRLYAN